MITIVTSSTCPYCMAAKSLITSLWYEYKEKVVALWSNELMDIVRTTWLMTVPQIFAWKVSKENLLWGFNDIETLNKEWKLQEILGKVS